MIAVSTRVPRTMRKPTKPIGQKETLSFSYSTYPSGTPFPFCIAFFFFCSSICQRHGPLLPPIHTVRRYPSVLRYVIECPRYGYRYILSASLVEFLFCFWLLLLLLPVRGGFGRKRFRVNVSRRRYPPGQWRWCRIVTVHDGVAVVILHRFHRHLGWPDIYIFYVYICVCIYI